MSEHLVFITSLSPGDAGAITAFKLNTDAGTLEQLHRNTDVENPFFIALSPDRKYLYSVHITGDFENDAGAIASFEIVNESGELRKINEKSAQGRTTCYVDIDPSGKAVVLANYSSGSVGSFAVQDDGSLSDMVSFFEHQGPSTVNEGRQQNAHAHCATLTPSGNHMYACDLGCDKIYGYALDAASATLTPLAQPFVRTIGGAGPRHFTLHPQGGYAYANNELLNSINVYSHDESTGTLIERQLISTLPDDYDGDSYTADIKITPNGKFLYCSNRIHDSIACYSINSDGTLTLLDIPSSRGNFAQNLAITPDNSFLLCANMHAEDPPTEGSGISLYRIEETGHLTPLGDFIDHHKPSCIMIV